MLNKYKLYFRLVGPNSGQSWAFEGKRRIPLMPRGIPQTIYTEIADRAAEAAAAENKEILKKREEKLVALKTNEEEVHEAECETEDCAISSTDNIDVSMYPPLVIEDQSFKVSNLQPFLILFIFINNVT